MSATLMGTRRWTRHELAELPTPLPTKTWKPVPHYDLVSALAEELERQDVEVTREEYVTAGKSDAKIYGVLGLRINDLANPDYSFLLGFRGSNDRSMAISATAGVNVFACENGCFSGDSGTVVLRRRHTSRLNLAEVMPEAIGLFLQKAGAFREDINRMREFTLDDRQAKEVIYDAFVGKRAVMPLRVLPLVSKLYFDDPEQRDKFQARSLWSLNNSFTETVKSLQDVPRYRADLNIGRHFARVLYGDRGLPAAEPPEAGEGWEPLD